MLSPILLNHIDNIRTCDSVKVPSLCCHRVQIYFPFATSNGFFLFLHPWGFLIFVDFGIIAERRRIFQFQNDPASWVALTGGSMTQKIILSMHSLEQKQEYFKYLCVFWIRCCCEFRMNLLWYLIEKINAPMAIYFWTESELYEGNIALVMSIFHM